VVTAVDVRAVGLAVVALGGGRRHEAEDVDHAVGLSEIAAPGERVGPADMPLAVVHARSDADAEAAIAALRAAYTIGEEAPPERPVVLERLGATP
jgi:thymidine phosphorylase